MRVAPNLHTLYWSYEQSMWDLQHSHKNDSKDLFYVNFYLLFELKCTWYMIYFKKLSKKTNRVGHVFHGVPSNPMRMRLGLIFSSPLLQTWLQTCPHPWWWQWRGRGRGKAKFNLPFSVAMPSWMQALCIVEILTKLHYVNVEQSNTKLYNLLCKF